MLCLIKRESIVFLSFSSTLGTRCLPLNNEPGFFRPNLIGLNHVDLKYHPFMVSHSNGCCVYGNDLFTKTCFLKKKNKNVKSI